MPRSFPLSISIGTDICSLKRISSILAHPTRIGYGHRFINKVFTNLEKDEDNGPFKARVFPFLERYDRYLERKQALQSSKLELGVDYSQTEPNSHSDLNRCEEHLRREDINLQRELAKAARSVGGRFAAKEAAIKAYRTRRLTYRDVSILRYNPSITRQPPPAASRAPTALIRNKEAESDEDSWLDAQEVPVSISHDGDFATAVCVASEQPVEDDWGKQEVEEGDRLTKAQDNKFAESRDNASLPSTASSSLASVDLNIDTLELYRSTIFIFGLDFRAKRDDLQLILRQPRYMPKISINRDTDGKSLGTAFAVMASPEDAVRAVKHLKELRVLNRYVGSDTCDGIRMDANLQKRLRRIVEPSKNATRFERWHPESLDKCVGVEEFPGLSLARSRYTKVSAKEDAEESKKDKD